MGAFDSIKAKLPAFIVRGSVLDDQLGPLGASIDTYIDYANEMKTASGPEGGNPVLQDALAADYGLIRNYRDTDKIMAIRLYNAIRTHQQRGSQEGLDIEGHEISQSTPYMQSLRYIIGVNAIGIGYALGGVGAEWIQFWNDTPEPEADIKARMNNLLPLHLIWGLDYINAFIATSGYKSIKDEDLLNDVTYSITNDGFYDNRNTLIADKPSATYEFGNIDLGADFADYQWLADWVDYAAWDVIYAIKVQIRFSSDEISWSSWTPYDKNQWVANSEINRYAQFKIALTMTEYRSLEHYIFRSFILKGLTLSQRRYGPHRSAHEVLPQIGN